MAPRDRVAFRDTEEAVCLPKGSESMDKDCPDLEKTRSFRTGIGAHKECGHLS